MKIATLLAVILPLALAPFASAKPSQPGAAKLTVNFPGWQKYTDIKDASFPTDRGEQAILNQLRQGLESDAHYLVPDGDHLTLTFSDIDLTGDFEPGRGPDFDEIRIIKDVYPPRFVFNYVLTDASGRTLLSGNETLTNLDFDLSLSLDTTDPLHYDKDTLKDWMQRKLHGI